MYSVRKTVVFLCSVVALWISLSIFPSSEVYSLRIQHRGSSVYEFSNPSPQEAVGYLVDYLSRIDGLQGTFTKYAASLSYLSEDKFEEIAEECLVEMRSIFNGINRDSHFVMLELLPKEVYSSYDVLFRYLRKSLRDVDEELNQWGGSGGNYGYINISAFADGEGSYFIDNYGMPGKWDVEIRTEKSLPNRFVMRTVDAVYMALKDYVLGMNFKVRIVIIDSISDIDGLDIINKSAGFSSDKRVLFIERSFSEKSREEQRMVVSKIINPESAKLLTVEDGMEETEVEHILAKDSSEVIVTSIAMVETGRARDYLHYKFNYRLQTLTQELHKESKKAVFRSVETSDDFEVFINKYAENKQDIVLLSLYQLKPAELDMLHKLVSRIRVINSDVFVMVEGPVTIHAKQILALCPEIDMMVRGEADQVVSMLMELKAKGVELTKNAGEYLLDKTDGGIFLRVKDHVFISNLNKTNVSHNIKLLDPQREMTAIWYTEHGCPYRCAFCRKDTGGIQHRRIVSADERVGWMLNRLMLEINPQREVTIGHLMEVLEQQGRNQKQNISGIGLLPDTFIGRDKVEIIVVSENALVNRKVMMQFAENIRRFGLQKYFRIKICDANILTLVKNGKPDREYIRALKQSGIYFIGFGSENLSRTILSDLRKGYTENAEGYTADEIIAVNKVLLEEGFDPTYIRHNMLLNTPDSTIEDVKSAMLLMYLAPVYNSVYSYFSNGWGNARNSRMYVMEGSLWTAADTVRYAERYRFKDSLKMPEFTNKEYVITDHFYIARNTPEYLLRAEDAPLNYIDERIHPLSSDFAYPHFYRYKLSSFIDKNFRESDVDKAMSSWQNSVQGREINALAMIVNRYKTIFRITGIKAVKMIKAHMVSLGELSFVSYKDLLGEKKNIPQMLEVCGVSDLIGNGDSLMVPGQFNPEEAMSYFFKAHLMGEIIRALDFLSINDRKILRQIALVCLDDSITNHAKVNAVIMMRKKFLTDEKSDFIRDLKSILDKNVLERKNIKGQGYIRRMSYPDQQIFEYLKHLYVLKSDFEIFNMIVRRMNERHINFQAAIKELACERMGSYGEEFSDDDYNEYVKSVKEYGNVYIYGKRGLLSQLGGEDSEAIFVVIRKLLGVISSEENPHIVKSIALNLRDMAKVGTALKKCVFIVPPETIAKIQYVLNIDINRDMLFGESKFSLTLLSNALNNRERALLVQRSLPVNLLDTSTADGLFNNGNWYSFYVDGDNIIMKGGVGYEERFLEGYSGKMEFHNNIEMFAEYITRFSELSGRHRSRIWDEIEEFFEYLGVRPSTRYMMLMEERFLYMLPVLLMAKENPESRMILAGRGMEPFWHSLQILIDMFGMSDLKNRIFYTPIFRRSDYDNPQNMLLAQSIIFMLTEEELTEKVSEDIWEQIEMEINKNYMRDELNGYLEKVWGVSNGVEELKNRHISMRQALIYFADFGIDPRFMEFYIKAREAYLANVFMKEDFKETLTYDKNDLIRRIFAAKRANRYLNENNRENIRTGLSRLTDDKDRLLNSQRELIHGYVRIYGYADEVADLKNNMVHKGRLILNLLLKDTAMAEKLKSNTIISVDETNISGVSLLLIELIARVFNGSQKMRYYAYNVAQRTDQTDTFLKEKNILDFSSVANLWPQEDINEEFLGMYVDGEKGKRFLAFKRLKNIFRVEQDKITPDRTEKELSEEVELFNKKIDRYIEDNELFVFIDGIKTLRYDVVFVKREFFKLFLRKEYENSFVVNIHKNIFMEDIVTAIKINEADSPVVFKFRDKIREISKKMQFSNIGFVQDIRSMDKRIIYADVNSHLERYIRRNRQMSFEYIRIGNVFTAGDMGEKVLQYLNGQLIFKDLKDYFYKNYRCEFNDGFYDLKKVLMGSDSKDFSHKVKEVQEKIFIEAHRGKISQNIPENTLEAFRKASDDSRIDMIELDIQLTKDGQFVIVHDHGKGLPALGTDKRGKLIRELTLEEIKNANPDVPSFEEVLAIIIPSGKRLHIDVKDYGRNGEEIGMIVRKLVSLMADKDIVDRVYVGSFNVDILREVRRLSSDIEINYYGDGAVSTIRTIDGDLMKAREVGASLISLRYEDNFEKLIDRVSADNKISEDDILIYVYFEEFPFISNDKIGEWQRKGVVGISVEGSNIIKRFEQFSQWCATKSTFSFLDEAL